MLLLVFLWAVVLVGPGYLALQSVRGQFDLSSLGTLANLFYLLLFGAVAVGATLYVRARWA